MANPTGKNQFTGGAGQAKRLVHAPTNAAGPLPKYGVSQWAIPKSVGTGKGVRPVKFVDRGSLAKGQATPAKKPKNEVTVLHGSYNAAGKFVPSGKTSKVRGPSKYG